jgi:hypothetical protein
MMTRGLLFAGTALIGLIDASTALGQPAGFAYVANGSAMFRRTRLTGLRGR